MYLARRRVAWRSTLILPAIVLGGLVITQQALAAESSRPNFLVLVTDDQGWWDLACHGNPVIKTPRLDRLCDQSVEFTRFYVSPVCSLTRASILTGRYPLRTGCYDTRFGHDTLNSDEVTVAEVLKRAGYHTALFGKWHQGRYMNSHPNNRGFEEFFGFWQYGHVERYFYPDRMWHNRERVECRGHITEQITDATIDYVANIEGPFCCFVTYNVPHAPFQAPPALVARYLNRGLPLEDAQIYALVEHCDSNIGRLLDALEENDLDNNTVVLFLSDNGGISKYFRAGLRGQKGSVYEGGVLSPFFARYPGHFPAGAKIDALTGAIDIMPTLVALADAKLPDDRAIDGADLAPLLQAGQGDSPHKYMYHHWSRDIPRDDKNWAIGDSRHKLVNGQLYDLLNDPAEANDLAAEKPQIAQRLRDEYVRWFKDVTNGQQYGRVRIEVGREDENPVELQMSWAKLKGEHTRYTFDAYDWDVVDGWDHVGDAVDWEIAVTRPGKYEVRVAYGCGQTDAGGAFSVRVGEAATHGTIEATPTVNTFVSRTVGTIELPAGDATIRVTAERIPGRQLMAFNRLWLKRID
ncbi:MAG: sulfatase-like hydrolase/transferase [Planctomycetes bacterium]|nr:sulfatase-like hydrolase/transferase [Planctomycetota bacterium]